MMMSSRTSSSSRRVDVGTPPPTEGHRWESREICFHNFLDLPSGRGEAAESPKFSCLGHRWELDVFPGGVDDSPPGAVAVDLSLASPPGRSVDVEFYLSVRDAACREVAHCAAPTRKTFDTSSYAASLAGKDDFAMRTDLEGALVGGTLTVEVFMRKGGGAPPRVAPSPFVPENPLREYVLGKFMDEESADVVFEVGGEGEREEGAAKRAKLAPTTFPAHRFVLEGCASTFSELCRTKANGGEATAIRIPDLCPEVFRLLLFYAYGGKVSDQEMGAHGKDLIAAADKYGLVALKLEAEARYVAAASLAVDNVRDHLLFAQAKNCALLKEAAMDFVAKEGDAVMDRVSFDGLPGSIVKDLWAALARGKKDDSASDGPRYNGMRVGVLRKLLHEKGLDVDGSREAMIALLKEHT